MGIAQIDLAGRYVLVNRKYCEILGRSMQELIGICHRILVMRSGRIVGEVSGAAMTEDEIVVYATGIKTQEAATMSAGRI